MIHEIASVRVAGKALAATALLGFVLTTTVAVVLPTDAQAQTKPAETKKPAAKPAPKPAQSQAQPQQSQVAPPAGSDQQPHLMYSPWIKICNKNQQDPNAKEVCVTAKDGRLENGMPVAAVALIEPKGIDKKLIRVTVPLGMQLQHGTRMIIDQEQPMTAPYFMCFPNGCMADYEASTELIGKLKKGKQLTVQAINMNGTPISLPLPLADFAKAHDGPPTDPKVFEEQQRKLQEELQKKAEEARKKLQAQPPAEAPKQ
jgi:invasion protein IalB